MKLPFSPKIPWGAVLTLAGEVVSRASIIVFQFLIAYGLGVKQYGSLGVTLASAAVLTPLADLGVNSLVLRFLSNNPDKSAYSKLLAPKLLGLILFICGLFFWQWASGRHGESLPAMWLAGFYYALNSFNEFLRQTLRAREASVKEFRSRLAFPILVLISTAFFWLIKPGLIGALIAYTIPPAGLTVFYLIALRNMHIRLTPEWSFLPSLWKQYRSFLIQSFIYIWLICLSVRLELWVIDTHRGREEVGRYFAAYMMVFAGTFFGQALSAHMYPNLHRLDRSLRNFWRAFAAHAGLAFFLWGVVHIAGQIVFAKVYPRAGYETGLLFIHGFGLLLAMSTLNYLWLSIFIGADKQWIASVALLATMGLKFFLGNLWVPEQGGLGMIQASYCSEIPGTILLGVLAFILYQRKILIRQDLG